MRRKKYLRSTVTKALQFVLSSQRGCRKMSQYQLSRKCGISRQYLSMVESGKRIPTLSFTLNMARGFDMNIEDFMGLLVEKVSDYNKKP